MRNPIRRHRLLTATLVDAYLASRRAKGLEPQTLVSYEHWLKHFTAAYPVLPSTAEAIETFTSRWRGITRCNAFRNVAMLYAWLVRTRRIPPGASPFPFMDPPKRPKKLPRMFSDTEVLRIVTAAQPGQERALVLTLLDGAPRIGELVRRTKDDLVAEGIKLDGKRGERMIPLLSETIAYLKEQPGHWLFAKKDGHGRWIDQPAHVNTLKNRFAQVIERAGITGRRRGPHTVRHTSAVKWLHSSGNIYALRDLLGHASVKETEVYARMLLAHQLADMHRSHSALRQFEQAGVYERAS